MSKLKGYALGVTSSATFGLIPLFSLPLLQAGMNTPSILMFRFGIAAIVVAAIILGKHLSAKVTWRQVSILALMGVLNFFSALLLFTGYSYMSSGVTTVTHFVYPIFVSLIMFLFFGQKMPWSNALAIVLAIMGVALLAGVLEGDNRVSLLGLFIVVLSGLAYALYIVVVNKSGISSVHYLTITFYVMLFDCLLFGLFAATSPGITPPLAWNHWGLLLLLALLPSVVSNITLVLAIDLLGSTPTAILGAMEPVTAVGVGALFFGEQITLWQGIGIFAILLAVFVIVRSNRRP